MKVFIKIIAFLFLYGINWHAAYAQEFDILGLKLGMNITQVHEALKTYGVNQNDIRESRQFYRYTDGVEQFQTDNFVTYINAQRNKDGSTTRRSCCGDHTGSGESDQSSHAAPIP